MVPGPQPSFICSMGGGRAYDTNEVATMIQNWNSSHDDTKIKVVYID